MAGNNMRGIVWDDESLGATYEVVDIPEDLEEAISECKTDKEAKKIGIEWCIEQSKELMKANVPCLHYYTMGTSEVTRRIACEIF
jgi:methylenetetrahydrofolate reductase (NADPH)